MSKKKKKNKPSFKVIDIHVPAPKKWELDQKALLTIYAATSDANQTKYDIESFLTALVIGLSLAEDDDLMSQLFKRKEEEE